MSRITNIIADAVAAVIILMTFLKSKKSYNATPIDKLYNYILYCVVGILVTDIASWAFDGKTFHLAGFLCFSANTVYYFLQIVFCRLWLKYVHLKVNGYDKQSIILEAIISIPMLAETIVLILNIWFHSVFYVTNDNHYVRGELYFPNLIFHLLYVACVLYIIICGLTSGDNEKRRLCTSLLVYMLPPTFGAIVQNINYGQSLLWPFAAISLLMISMKTQSRAASAEKIRAVNESARAIALENELTECRVKIMLSQIQPHFLFNSLSVIQALCDTQPKIAAKATEDFANYMRCIIESLESNFPIPFEQELRHVKYYVSLEKLRFPDRLDVHYDIGTLDFSLPAMTLQPIVENAIRYGVTKREEGGTVEISVKKSGNNFIIIVSDNGLGADYTCPVGVGSHEEIISIKERLQKICDGNLEVKSVLGTGTDVIITIPKRGK